MNKKDFAKLKIPGKEIVRITRIYWPKIINKIRSKGFSNVYQDKKGWGYFNTLSALAPGRKTPCTYVHSAGCGYHCTMCCYNIRDKSRKITKEKLKKSVKEVLDFIERSNNGYKEGVFILNTGGSFFDPIEIPLDLREYVLKRVASNRKKHEKIMFRTECRFEFITEKLLKEIRSYLGQDTIMRFDCGIESTNFLIREACINKELPDDYLDKIELIKKYGMEISTNIILKPPFLTEKEAITDAVKSTKDIYTKTKIDNVVVMTMNSRPLTLINELEKAGHYNLPSIWSSLMVMKKIGPKLSRRTSFRGFIAGGSSGITKVVKGCNKCGPILIPRILKFNKAGKDQWKEILEVANSVNCSCKKEWHKRINKKDPLTLKQRILFNLDFLMKRYLNKGIEEYL